MAEKTAGRIDQELVRALAHPTRVAVLEALEGRVASPSELSRELGQDLGVVAYHAGILVECGCIELVHTKPRRGALEHFYALSPRSSISHQDWRRAPLALRSAVTAATLESFVDRAVAAIEAGTVDCREDTTLSWMPITVDDAGWREVAEIMDRALRMLMAVHARCTKRLGEAEGIPVVVGLAGFEASRRGGGAA